MATAKPVLCAAWHEIGYGGALFLGGAELATGAGGSELLGAVSLLVVFEIARRALDDQTAWLAAGLWAFFPLSIFYEAQLTTHGLEPVLGALLLLLRIRSLRKQAAARPRFSVVFMLGLALGVSALLRPTFLILAPFMFGSLLLARGASWQAGLAEGMLLAAATCIPIGPVTWHNYAANGQFQLLTSNSAVTIYLGNNRDSTGLAENSPAFNAAHYLVGGGRTTYMALAAQDIRRDPLRLGRLLVRKAALYLGNAELPNNVDFNGKASQSRRCWDGFRCVSVQCLRWRWPGCGLYLWVRPGLVMLMGCVSCYWFMRLRRRVWLLRITCLAGCVRRYNLCS